jgi:hypothetical protein
MFQNYVTEENQINFSLEKKKLSFILLEMKAPALDVYERHSF